MMINIYYLAISFYLVIFQGKAETPDGVKIHLIDVDEELVVNLKKVDSYLANENLPVWTVSKYDNSKLILDKTVMKNVMQFTMYQDSDHSSAAVYFHKIHKLFGTIDVRYIINKLPINDINNPYQVTDDSFDVIKRKSESCLHESKISADVKQDSIPLEETIGSESSTSLQNIPEVVYVKVLILVNFDLTRELRAKSDNTNILIVARLLTLFNSVDMLYSKVDEPKIKINIAGIIIGTTPASFEGMSACYTKHKNIIYINPGCSNFIVERYLREHHDDISPDSYDAAIFLTRFTPRVQPFYKKYTLGGATSSSTLYPYKMKTAGLIGPLITAIYLKDAGSFHIIAHELAHALRYSRHDKEPYVDNNNKCNAHLMKKNADCCINCLSWSRDTKEHFKKFFNSRERCFFINKPLSLEERKPRITWDADEQCKCYGYDKALANEMSWTNKIFRIPKKEMCNTNLRCSKDSKSHKAPFPMDGTPCDAGKVCWNRKCEQVPNDESNEIPLLIMI